MTPRDKRGGDVKRVKEEQAEEEPTEETEANGTILEDDEY